MKPDFTAPIAIIGSYIERIVKYLFRLVEADEVIAKVEFRLLRIPGELTIVATRCSYWQAKPCPTDATQRQSVETRVLRQEGGEINVKRIEGRFVPGAIPHSEIEGGIGLLGKTY